MPKVAEETARRPKTLVDRDAQVHASKRRAPSSRRRRRQVRRDGRPRRSSRRQSQARRPDGPRRDRAPARHRANSSAFSCSPRATRRREAEAAGADFAGATTRSTKVQEGFMDFDRVIATPDMMGRSVSSVVSSARAASCRTPRSARSRSTSADAVSEAKAGKVEYRVEKAGIVHARIGKVSFTEQALADNADGAHPGARSRRSRRRRRASTCSSITLIVDDGPRRAASTRRRVHRRKTEEA